MFTRRAGRRVRAVVDGVARLRDADLASWVAAVRGTDAGSVECLSLAVAAVTEAIGRPVTDDEVAAGVALCAGVALDDLGISDTPVVLAVPAVAHALLGGTHHVSPTHDDAVRHAAWLRPVAAVLGLRIGLLEPGDGQAARRESHQAEIVCGAVNEFAYDVLRDWLTWDEPVTVARRVAVIDQLDVVLLDLGDTTPQITMPSAASADSAAHDEWQRWAERAGSSSRCCGSSSSRRRSPTCST